MMARDMIVADIKDDIIVMRQQINEQKARYKSMYANVRHDYLNKSVELVKAE